MLVGEMRDLETIQTALDDRPRPGTSCSARCTPTTRRQAIDRIVDVFPADRQAQIRVQLAASLTGVVAQRLMPRIGGGRWRRSRSSSPRTRSAT